MTTRKSGTKTRTRNKSGFLWLLIPAGAILLALVLNLYILVFAYVPSGSMENTIPAGSLILGSRLSYRNEMPERGDIVFFRREETGNTLLIKRVIAVEGDSFSVENGSVTVNGDPVSEPYALPDSSNFESITVPEGMLILLGDNRANSKDSRFWEIPYVSVDNVVGKATLILFPRVGKLS